ncbi:fimbrial protein [Escherichia sp. 93.0816]|uniref:fimbrial protein n=1 Tax=Escherichia sp. 93.0816 TaxID=2723308 RepID=UPI001593AE0E|nr:fimbrial protein [Escherichia sp. 93.0816]EFB2827799.1 fimbrial protein [Escherichia coli]MBB2332100.1 fimbrial protein [Escherichia sp. 93.0816]
MYKFILALFIAILSLSSIPAIAANCSGGGIAFQIDPNDSRYFMKGYTSADNAPLLLMNVTLSNSIDCQPDYIENAVKKSKMTLKMTGGGSCKTPTTITTPYPNIEWQLEGMTCSDGFISSNNIKSVDWDGKAHWPAGTSLGKARLVVNDQYWIQNTQAGEYTVNIPILSAGNTLVNSPAINVSSILGAMMTFIFNDIGTCSMSLYPENIDFGKLTPNDVNSSIYKEIMVSYSCKNKALINGLYVRFAPENVVDAANGLFSASDSNGRKLNFQITRQYGNLQTIPLNTNYKIFEPYKYDLDATATFRINVKPSTPLPVGKVSTYLNVSLIYR